MPISRSSLLRRERIYAVAFTFGNAFAFRGAFVIDKNGMVRSQIVNDLPIGRNIDEILRIIDAVQFFEEHGEVCPAGWQKGKAGMKASSKGVADYLTDHSDSL